jgi:WD40 repeat protein
MMTRHILGVLYLISLTAPAIGQQKPVKTPGDDKPHLRLEGEGPTSFVTALAFNQDGTRLYAGGWDKVVRTWSLNKEKKFELEKTAYRVPLGPAVQGMINAIAVSEDETWVAIAGSGAYEGGPTFTAGAQAVPAVALSPRMRLDMGMIYVFNTRNNKARLLRSHKGYVLSLAFAPSRRGRPSLGQPPLLVSAAAEVIDGKEVGTVRLWNVESDEPAVSAVTDLQIREDVLQAMWRPGLAVWRTGDGPKQVRVAIVWNDEYLRLWNAEQAGPWRTKIVGANPKRTSNLAIASVPDGEKIFTAVRTATAETRTAEWLSLWKPAGSELKLQLDKPLGEGDPFPRAMAICSSKANGKLDLAAVVVARASSERENQLDYHLQILDLVGDNFAALKTREAYLWSVSLASQTQTQPTLATAPRGGYLAVAGDGSGSIRIFSIKDLLEGKNEPQMRQSVGTVFEYASFVRKEGTTGLLLSQLSRQQRGKRPGSPRPNDRIYNFTTGKLTGDTEGWTAFAPVADDWQAKLEDDERRAVVVSHGEEHVTIPFDRWDKVASARVRIYDFALLPPKALNVPILAVAFRDEGGAPRLCLYNATSGDKVRELNAHTDRIYSLAFSGEGKVPLLVSTSQDHTVCVWRMSGLREVVGQMGVIPGLAVTNAEDGSKRVIVNQVAAESPARDKLAKNDVIEGLVENNELKRLDSFTDFYSSIRRIKPGGTATLQMRGKGNVSLDVGQAVDMRNPLFCLFAAQPRGGDQDEWEWIAWSPAGPYDPSSRNAERYVGWHFNTGKLDAPTRFAATDQYRKEFYRPGLVKSLYQKDIVPPPPPPPPPQMTLAISDAGRDVEPDGLGDYFVRRPTVKLRVGIHGRPASSLQAVTWSLDGGEEHPFDLAASGNNLLFADLPSSARGKHRLTVTARTPHEKPSKHDETLTLRYQPLPPAIAPTGPATIVVEKPKFVFEKRIRLSVVGGTVELFLNDKLLKGFPVTANPPGPIKISETIPLQPDMNQIKLVAVNQGALAGYEQHETAIFSRYVILHAKQPVISLSARPVDGTRKGQDLAFPIAEPLEVPKVVIEGTIEADVNLTEATWRIDNEKSRPLTTFVANQATKFSINQMVDLKPGAQTLTFHAKTAARQAERSVSMFYRPPTPTVVIAPAPERERVYGEADTGEAPIKAWLAGVSEYDRYQVVRDGEVLAGVAVQINKATRTLTAKVPLHPLRNLIQVRVSNQWGGMQTSEEVSVYYLRPPRILSVQGPEKVSKPSMELVAQVKSPRPLLEKSVRVEVSGVARSVKAEVGKEVTPGINSLTIRELQLSPDEEAKPQEIHIWVSNEEAQCLEPGTKSVVYTPAQPPPVVSFVYPTGNSPALLSRSLNVQVSVKSESALEYVQLVLTTQPGQETPDSVIPIPLSNVKGKKGEYWLEETVPVKLKPGGNYLRLEAKNAGGLGKPDLRFVGAPIRPVAIEVEEFELPGGEKISFEQKLLGRDRLGQDEKLSSGIVTVKGYVPWDDVGDVSVEKEPRIRAFVNGFYQSEASLEAPDKGKREFRLRVFLNKEEDNHVLLRLPDLKEDLNSRELSLNCKGPVTNQRLYLLVMSIQQSDNEKLISQFLDTGAFTHIEEKKPLAGFWVQKRYIDGWLEKVKSDIPNNAKRDPGNDVVVIYYEGDEAISQDGHLFQTKTHDSHFKCDDLAESLENTFGAHLLLFDVEQQKALNLKEHLDRISNWRKYFSQDFQRHVSALRYAWIGRAAPRLLEDLKKAFPNASKLVQIQGELQRLVAKSKGLIYEDAISEEMKDLVLTQNVGSLNQAATGR